MPLHEKQMGQNGQKPERCAISGKPLAPEDVYIGVNGVEIGVKGYLYAHLSPELKAQLKAEWAKDVSELPKSAPAKSSAAVRPTADQPKGE